MTTPPSGYPDDWDERRRKVLQRDDYTCQSKWCDQQGGPYGSTELHVHHITPKSEGGTHEYSNLITLCGTHHNNQHTHDISESNSKPSTLETMFRTFLLLNLVSVSGTGFLAVAAIIAIAIGFVLISFVSIQATLGLMVQIFVVSLLALVGGFTWVIYKLATK